jgi:signal transduction histidine kinase
MRVAERNAALAGFAAGAVGVALSWWATAAWGPIVGDDDASWIARIVSLHRGAPALWVVDTLPMVTGWCGLLWSRARWGLGASDLGPVAEALPDAALLVGPSGVVSAANSSANALFGGSPVGHPIDRLVPSSSSREPSPVEVVLGQGQRLVEWARVARALDGSARPVRVGWGQGPGRTVLLVLRPIPTEPPRASSAPPVDGARLAEVEAELAQVRAESAAKSAMVASVSHELRTPLSAIIGYAELLEEEGGSSDELQRISGAARHVLTLVNTLLDLAKLQAGRLELVSEPVAARGLLDELRGLVSPIARANVVRFDVDDNVPWVRGDRTRVLQILLNLLSNACKFTDAGTITLRVTSDGAAVAFAVEDSGIGMDAAQLASLFEDFVQVHHDPSRGGTGLGLALSRRLAEAMGGRIDARSAPGRGSTFTLTLPAMVSSRTLAPMPSFFRPAAEVPPLEPVVWVALSAERGLSSLLRRDLGVLGFAVEVFTPGQVAVVADPRVVAVLVEPGHDQPVRVASGGPVATLVAGRSPADVAASALEPALRAALRQRLGVRVDVRAGQGPIVDGLIAAGWRVDRASPIQVADHGADVLPGAVWVGDQAPEGAWVVVQGDQEERVTAVVDGLSVSLERRLVRRRG